MAELLCSTVTYAATVVPEGRPTKERNSCSYRRHY